MSSGRPRDNLNKIAAMMRLAIAKMPSNAPPMDSGTQSGGRRSNCVIKNNSTKIIPMPIARAKLGIVSRKFYQ